MSTYSGAALHSKGGRPPLDPPKGVTKTARHAKIITLLEQHEVRSQTELAEQLADDGVQVNQATLSRDLVEIGALRVRNSGGHLVYAVPSEGGDRTPHVGEFATFEGRLAGCALRSWCRPKPLPTSSCCVPHLAQRSTSPERSIGSAGTRSSAPLQVTTRSC